MDRRTIGAFAIIALIIIATPYYMRWVRGEDPFVEPAPSSLPMEPAPAPGEPARTAAEDSTPAPALPESPAAARPNTEPTARQPAAPSVPEQTVTVDTDRFTAVFTSRGGRLVSSQLKDYVDPNGSPLELISPGSAGLGVYLGERDLSEYPFVPNRTSLHLTGSEQAVLTFTADVDGRQLTKRIRIQGDRYRMEVELSVSRLADREHLALGWDGSLAHTEDLSVRDPTQAQIVTLAGGEVESWNTTRLADEEENPPSGQITWVGVRNKYFAATLIPPEGRYELQLESRPEVRVVGESREAVGPLESLMLEGRLDGAVRLRESPVQGMPGHLIELRPGVDATVFADRIQQQLPSALAYPDDHYQAIIHPDYAEPSVSYGLYLGPLTYQLLRRQNTVLNGNVRELGMDNFMDYGWAIFRPIMKPLTIVILHGFQALHQVIPNYGLVIIVFSILVKIVVFPLTHKSLESAAKMQEVQPQMTALREKYGDDQQKLNQEMMKLYKEQKINPLGGCLPMLLQMPILISLFNVFRGAIELRQAGFMLWITDLSQPDSTGIMLPVFGELHVLPLLMAVSTFLQSKMTMKDPKQAAMVYVMPVMMTFFFWTFSSGLVLYWTMFNLLTLVQQRVMEQTKEVLATAKS